ncbi:leucine-rich repeat-containing protein 59 [Anopheles maculipalpis]|uniref:leucine-rich repeat-containing protein 59 n=1 Tax=Anopheles maculipalpis TaxID=1496333 RepID=UPI0021590C16|nr:leucine-rich repeat-containing protein 59 [Anopheles maculipalpis]
MAMQQNESEEKINVRDRLVDNVLDLSLMNIAKVPVQEIKPLRRATVLDLSNNRITIIESNFTDLTQLTQIDLSKNRITSICDDFGLLTNLRRLDLYKNQITKLPLTFGRLKNLKYLDLKENPLNPTFKKLIGTCSDTSDCLAAASRAVDFMKQVERRVVDDRTKERKMRNGEKQPEKPSLELKNGAEDVENSAAEEQKAGEKTKRRRKQVATQADSANGNQPKSKLKAETKAKSVTVSTGLLQHSLLFWVSMLILLLGSYLLVTKYNDVLAMARDKTFREARETILEEYIK